MIGSDALGFGMALPQEEGGPYVGPECSTEVYDRERAAYLRKVEAAADEDGPLTIAEALPDFDRAKHGERLAMRFPIGIPPYRPCGHWVLVQERSQVKRLASGLWIPDSQQEIDAHEEFLGRVIAIGHLAGHDKYDTSAMVPGWPWFRIGNFVQMQRYSTDRHQDAKGDNPPVWRTLPWENVLSVVTSVEVLL
jgi:co-chaperonin GroES (HSP10)